MRAGPGTGSGVSWSARTFGPAYTTFERGFDCPAAFVAVATSNGLLHCLGRGFRLSAVPFVGVRQQHLLARPQLSLLKQLVMPLLPALGSDRGTGRGGLIGAAIVRTNEKQRSLEGRYLNNWRVAAMGFKWMLASILFCFDVAEILCCVLESTRKNPHSYSSGALPNTCFNHTHYTPPRPRAVDMS